MDDEVVIRTFDYPHLAELARLHLEHHEIESRIDDALLVGMNPLLGPALGGIKLHVRKADARHADQLLREVEQSQIGLESDQDDDGEDSSRTPTARQRQDDEATTHDADQQARRACTAAWLGWFFCPGIAQLYSLALVLSVSPSQLSASGRRRYRIAWLLDGIAIALVLFLLVRAC